MSDRLPRRKAASWRHFALRGVAAGYVRPRPDARILWLALTLLLLASSPVSSHLTKYTGAERSSTVAEIWIDLDRILLQVEVGDLDRGSFETLLGAGPIDLSKPQFGLTLTAEDGAPLPGEVRVVERRPRTVRSTASDADPVRGSDGTEVTYVEVVYDLATRPETLTLRPPARIGSSESAAEIGFIVYHETIPVIDFQYLKRPEILRLDWSDPWYSAFANTDLKRHHDAPLMTFLYVEPYEVRFEVLMRLKELASWMQLDVADQKSIEAGVRPRLLEQIGRFVAQQSQVRIDGATSRPLLDRVEFVRVSPQGIQSVGDSQRLTLSTALVGVILAYVTTGPPQEVTATWTYFNERIPSIPATVIDPVSRLPYEVTPAEPTLRWTNLLDDYNYRVATIDAIAARAGDRLEFSVPGVLLCLAAALIAGFGSLLGLTGVSRVVAVALLFALAVGVWPHGKVAARNPFEPPYQFPEVEAIQVLQGLLQNTYRAFDFRAEDDVYDKLAVSVSGDLITDIYLQNRRRLVMQEQGGARAKVQDVQLLDAVQAGPPTRRGEFIFQCLWRITGTVNHWGHSHQRRNQYGARIAIRPVDETWKITALDVTEERRLP